MAQIPIADAERLLPVTNDYSLEPIPIAQFRSAIHLKRFCQQQRPVEHGVDELNCFVLEAEYWLGIVLKWWRFWRAWAGQA
jgi:hypothetical protein